MARTKLTKRIGGDSRSELDFFQWELPERHHVLDVDDYEWSELAALFKLARIIKAGRLQERRVMVPWLRGMTMMTLFYEPSTRTRVSFEMAGKMLGADVINVASTGSSVAKGESLLDTAKTLKAIGVDVIVVRHPQAGAPYLMARYMGEYPYFTSIINAGDGCHAHPTQALLDLFTILENRKRLDGLKVVIVGDVLHSRVARSNLWGLTAAGARIVLCAPPTLLPQEFLNGSHRRDGGPLASVEVDTNLERAIEGADVVMPLRLQLERQEAGLLPTLREYSRMYQVDERRLARARPGALVLHPGPMNEGVEISPQVAHGAQSLIEEQVHNGVAVRMALLLQLGQKKERYWWRKKSPSSSGVLAS